MFWIPSTTFENTPLCPPKYSIVREGRGVPDLLRVWNLHIFMLRQEASILSHVGWLVGLLVGLSFFTEMLQTNQDSNQVATQPDDNRL